LVCIASIDFCASACSCTANVSCFAKFAKVFLIFCCCASSSVARISIICISANTCACSARTSFITFSLSSLSLLSFTSSTLFLCEFVKSLSTSFSPLIIASILWFSFLLDKLELSRACTTCLKATNGSST